MKRIPLTFAVFCALLLIAATNSGTLQRSGFDFYFPIGDAQTIRWAPGLQQFYGAIRAAISSPNYLELSGGSSATTASLRVSGAPGNAGFTIEAQNASPIVLSQSVSLPKISVSGTNVAPGVSMVTLEVACGTSAHTAALVAYGGTSTVSRVVLDNIGLGVAGC